MKYFASVILLVAAIFQSYFSCAQRKGFAAGIEGGPGLRTLYGDGVSELSTTTGFAAGLTAQFSFTDVLAIRTGLSYELKGAMFKDVAFTDNAGNEVGMGDVKFNLKYLSLPVMFRATVSMDKLSVFGNIGLFGAFLLNEETTVSGVSLEDNTVDQTENYSEFDVGSALGVGGIYTINDMFNISAEFRNYLGFDDINEYQYGGPTKTMSTMFLVGLSHYIGKHDETKPK